MKKIEDFNIEEKQELLEISTIYFMVHQILIEENLEYLDSLPTKEDRIIQTERIRKEYHLWLDSLPNELIIKENQRIKNEYYENRR